MSKSVFQQLVEQTCAQANLKPSNNKADQQPANGKSNGHSKSVTNPSGPVPPSASQSRTTNHRSPVSKSPLTNHKSPIARSEEKSATPAQSPVAKLIARQIQDMDAANRAPRCQHIKANGVQCKSPAMRELPFCFFHEKFYNPPYDDSFPPLEDANSVQCAILQVLNGLKTKSITPLEARVMLYGLKAASINSRRTTFEPIMQAQVTEYPSFRRQQTDVPQSTSADRVVISTPSVAEGKGPAVDQKKQNTAAIADFLRAVKEQQSSLAPATASSVTARGVLSSTSARPPSTEVIPSERAARVEGPAFELAKH